LAEVVEQPLPVVAAEVPVVLQEAELAQGVPEALQALRVK
tara:strand:+ start:815 stop:934 length:120 start_codon:yes stop_codon:yes gene_type:complete